MELLHIIEARIARWMAYSDYCLGADFGLRQCRTFWVWAAIVAVVLALGVFICIRWRSTAGSTAVQSDGSNSAE